MVAPSKSWSDKIGATGGNKGKTAESAGTKALAGGASQASYDKGALSNVGQGDKTALHVETGRFNNSKRTEGGSTSESVPQSQPQPQKNLPTGVTPLTKPKPMGATPFVEGADLLGMATRFFGGIGGAAMSALGQALTGEDPTQSILGEHLGKQTGWSADPSMTPGRDRAQRGTTKRESFDQTTLGSASSTGSGAAAERPAARDAENFSDVQMADRRKPGLKQMLETMI